jgi:DNA-directed RNA polymerase alpha subunit
MLFRKGMGYASEDMNQKYLSRYLITTLREGWFYIGTQFSNGVISFVGNIVEMTGGTITYDLLKITIKTDGRITPEASFYNAFEILHKQIPFYFEKPTNSQEDESKDSLNNEKYNVSLKTLGLQPGTVNQLERNGIFTLKDLLQQNPVSLKLLRGFGNTRLTDVIETLANLGYEFKN